MALSIDELRARIDTTSAALRVATDEYEQLDQEYSAASRVTDELREEASVVAEETLRNAIDGYRNGAIPESILSAEDVNSSMRATTLGGAAVSADTAAFDAYRTLRKDLEITEEELVLRAELVADAEAEMARLEEQLTDELIRFGELEERRIQQEAAGVSIQAANRAQAAAGSRASTSTPARSTATTASSIPGASPGRAAGATRASTCWRGSEPSWWPR